MHPDVAAVARVYQLITETKLADNKRNIEGSHLLRDLIANVKFPSQPSQIVVSYGESRLVNSLIEMWLIYYIRVHQFSRHERRALSPRCEINEYDMSVPVTSKCCDYIVSNVEPVICSLLKRNCCVSQVWFVADAIPNYSRLILEYVAEHKPDSLQMFSATS